MRFEINGTIWNIIEVSQASFWEDDNELEKMNAREYFLGRTKFDKNEIWLYENLNKEQKRKTLYHELLHCYRGSYLTFTSIDNWDEDFWCDVSANSHDIIHAIVEKYFNRIETKTTMSGETVIEYLKAKVENDK